MNDLDDENEKPLSFFSGIMSAILITVIVAGIYYVL